MIVMARIVSLTRRPDMPQHKWKKTRSGFIVSAAGFVIVVAGMKSAASLINPFLLALFIATICAPPMVWMHRRKLPDFVAVIILVLGIFIVMLFLTIFVGSSLNEFTHNLPEYQERLSSKVGGAIVLLNRIGIDVSGNIISEYFDPGSAIRIVRNLLTGFSGVLTNGFMILLTVVFILLEASGFPAKVNNAFDQPESTMGKLQRITDSVNRYLGIKTIFSLITALAVYLLLRVIGVDHPSLWGLVAFLFNFVPNIGSIIAAIPAVLLAVVQLGFGPALLAAGGYVVINITVGSILEPRFMGRGLGLSTLVVFISLVFWGWILGPVGMLLSVPLTMILKIVLESNPETRWVATLMGSVPAIPKKVTQKDPENPDIL